MAIQMLGDQVLVAAAPKEERQRLVIILSADVKATASEPGVVMATGPRADQALAERCNCLLDWNKSLPVRIEGKTLYY